MFNRKFSVNFACFFISLFVPLGIVRKLTEFQYIESRLLKAVRKMFHWENLNFSTHNGCCWNGWILLSITISSLWHSKCCPLLHIPACKLCIAATGMRAIYSIMLIKVELLVWEKYHWGGKDSNAVSDDLLVMFCFY